MSTCIVLCKRPSFSSLPLTPLYPSIHLIPGTVFQAALLHDTIEDTDTSAAELEAKFGPVVARIVREVTDDKSLPKQERKRQQVAHAPHCSHQAKLVKLADKLYNLRDLNRCTPVGQWPPPPHYKHTPLSSALYLHNSKSIFSHHIFNTDTQRIAALCFVLLPIVFAVIELLRNVKSAQFHCDVTFRMEIKYLKSLQ